MRDALKRLLGRSAPPAARPNHDELTTTAEDRAIVERASVFSMTSRQRLQALVDAVRYCEQRGLPGAFAECGVWRGGSVLAMIMTLQELDAERDIYLYDTFEGMTAPTEHDVSPLDPPAMETWVAAEGQDERAWNELFAPELFGEEQVRATLRDTGYPEERLHFVRGPVEETLPDRLPGGPLALLRLDTDWYESTRHEMEHLYPELVAGGVLIIDDYGHWEGARRAVEEYFQRTGQPLLMNRIDYTGRIAVKH